MASIEVKFGSDLLRRGAYRRDMTSLLLVDMQRIWCEPNSIRRTRRMLKATIIAVCAIWWYPIRSAFSMQRALPTATYSTRSSRA